MSVPPPATGPPPAAAAARTACHLPQPHHAAQVSACSRGPSKVASRCTRQRAAKSQSACPGRTPLVSYLDNVGTSSVIKLQPLRERPVPRPGNRTPLTDSNSHWAPPIASHQCSGPSANLLDGEQWHHARRCGPRGRRRPQRAGGEVGWVARNLGAGRPRGRPLGRDLVRMGTWDVYQPDRPWATPWGRPGRPSAAAPCWLLLLRRRVALAPRSAAPAGAAPAGAAPSYVGAPRPTTATGRAPVPSTTAAAAAALAPAIVVPPPPPPPSYLTVQDLQMVQQRLAARTAYADSPLIHHQHLLEPAPLPPPKSECARVGAGGAAGVRCSARPPLGWL